MDAALYEQFDTDLLQAVSASRNDAGVVTILMHSIPNFLQSETLYENRYVKFLIPFLLVNIFSTSIHISLLSTLGKNSVENILQTFFFLIFSEYRL